VTGQEIRTAAEQYVGRTVTEAKAVVILNEALDQLMDLGLVYATIEVAATVKQWYDLPDDATFIVNVTNKDGDYYTGWEAIGNQIRFLTAGTFYVMARRLTGHLTTIAEIPEVHPMFHPVLVDYFKGYLKLQVNDESSDGLRLMQRFEERSQRVFNMLRRNTTKNHSWTVIRHA
jgi:hypothetical protein